MLHRALVAVLPIALASAAAHADGLYGGVGFGGYARVDGKLAERIDASDQVGGRIVVGGRSDNLSVEGVVFGTDFSDRLEGGTGSTLSLGVDVKLHTPLLLGLEGYLRGGINKTHISGSTALTDASGRGYDWGAGVEYRVVSGIVFPIEVTLWLDWNRQVLTLEGPEGDLPGEITMINVGVFVRSRL
jgi:opacity protein-like surface antigen